MKLKKRLAELQSVQTTNPAALPNAILNNFTDDTLSNLLSQLQGRQLAAGTNLVASANSDPPNAWELRVQIDKRINGIMSGLKANVESQKVALDELRREIKIATRSKAYPVKEQPYWEAKEQLGGKLDLHKLLADRIKADKDDLSVTKTALVTITSPAVAPLVPARPSRLLGAVMLVCGLAISGFGLCSFRNGGVAKVNHEPPNSL